MRTIDKIIIKVDGSRGAPMGRSNVLPKNCNIISIKYEAHKILSDPIANTTQIIYDCAVPMVDGAYDRGGAYWGCPSPGKGMGQLRVSYTKDLTYINFYRL